MNTLATGALAAGLFVCAMAVWAVPIVPIRDDEVIEVLPAAAGDRGEDKRLRKQLAARPDDAVLAVRLAQRDLDRARQAGDPRFAGLAFAALRPWPDASSAPAEVLLMRATLQQYMHQFDASVTSLRQLLARPGEAGRAQAWLTLATVLRVQGRYADSDGACRRLAATGADLHSGACLAENAALRGDVAPARRSFEALLSRPGLPPATQGWLLTSLAELEERERRTTAADAAYRRVLALGSDTYASIAYADFLIAQGRPADALATLQSEPRTDAVLLRLAIAGARAKTATAAADAAEMRERIALANQRPEAKAFHGREQAMFALFIEAAPARALSLARGNVEHQREPLDVLVLAEAAKASGDGAAIDEARRLKARLGLHDRRIDAAL
ncbi:MAG: hypothetical protein ABIQ06_04325 [Caldimonas sp.]